MGNARHCLIQYSDKTRLQTFLVQSNMAASLQQGASENDCIFFSVGRDLLQSELVLRNTGEGSKVDLENSLNADTLNKKDFVNSIPN